MEHMFKKFFSIALLCSSAVVLADSCSTSGCNTKSDDCKKTNKVVGCIIPRSQNKNNVIKNAGLDPDHQHLEGMDNFHGTFNVALEYTQTFSNDDLGRCLWGPAVAQECDDNAVQVRVRGSKGAGSEGTDKANGTSDLVAENFFLPKDFASNLTFEPKIKNVNVHFHFYAGLDEWANGLYFRLWAPVTHTRWNLGFSETAVTPGTTGFLEGEIAADEVTRPKLFENFSAYARGGSITIADDITVQPLRNHRFACDTRTETKLADLRAELGWNFVQCEDYHFGLYLEAAAPTGNECEPCYLFNPIVGNGNFWELGGGMTAHYTMWRSDDEEKQFDFFIEADVLHMFKHSETRVFDLKDKPLSRFMMAQKMQTPDGTLFIENDGETAPNAQFAKEYAPIANFSAQKVDVQVDVQGEVTAKFVYTCRGFNWEIGYDFWGKSCEDVSLADDCNDSCNKTNTSSNFAANTWALRGDAQAFGFQNNDTPIALGATRNDANIFSLSGGKTANKILGNANPSNDQIDNKKVAFDSEGNELEATTSSTDIGINTSNPAVFIKLEDLNISAGQRGISHKIFTNFNYTWIDRDDWIPYVGFGASAEFGKTSGSSSCDNNSNTTNTSKNTNCDSDCKDCADCAVSQWAVWLKGGVSFN